MRGRWIKTPRNGTAVVFVHGILSKEETSWRARSGAYWPEILSEAPTLNDLSVYVFTYRTGFFSGSFRLGDVVDALKEHMRLDGIFNCNTVVFVAHSMGGIDHNSDAMGMHVQTALPRNAAALPASCQDQFQLTERSPPGLQPVARFNQG